jgi:hypothetical protein
MIKLSLTLAFLFEVVICNGQYRHQLIKDTSQYKDRPFTIIKIENQPDWKVYNYLINNGDIKSTTIDSNSKTGKKAYFASFIRLNKNATLLDVNQLFKKYNISTKDYYLPVYIDSVIVYHRENACFQLSAIKSVKIKTETYTHQKYISISSIYRTNNPVADTYLPGVVYSPKGGSQ